MNTKQIPPFTPQNLHGAIGDVMRAAYAAGAADDGQSGSEAHMQLVMQCVGQLLTLCYQRDATPEEIGAVAGM